MLQLTILIILFKKKEKRSLNLFMFSPKNEIINEKNGKRALYWAKMKIDHNFKNKWILAICLGKYPGKLGV